MKKVAYIHMVIGILVLCFTTQGAVSSIDEYKINKLRATEISFKSALVGWNCEGTFKHYEVEFGELGFIQNEGQKTTTNMNPFQLSGLLPGEIYHCYVTGLYENGEKGITAGPIVIETLSPSFDYDAAIYSELRYTKIPISQAVITPEGRIKNSGNEILNDVVVQFGIIDEKGHLVFQQKNVLPQLMPGQSERVQASKSFESKHTGEYSIKYSISHPKDQNKTNNEAVSEIIEVTEHTYSRDDGEIENGLGISGDGSVFQGNEFEIHNKANLVSVDVHFSGGQAGDKIQVQIYEMNGTLPGNLIGNSRMDVLKQAGTGFRKIHIEHPLQLSPGKYIVGLMHYANGKNISLSYSESSFLRGTSWTRIDDGDWEHPEESGFEVCYLIRPVVGSCESIQVNAEIKDALKARPTNASERSLGSVSLDVSGGIPPYNFQWSEGSTDSRLDGLSPGTYCVKVTDAANCSKTSCYEINSSTARESLIENDILLQAFPNPANETLSVTIKLEKPAEVRIEILDILGNVLEYDSKQTNFVLQKYIDLTTYAAGIYFIRVSADGQQQTKRFLVNKI